mmetsp:Transcript_100070/g.282470  ORF Transcript_100070/g.282470 Transcript_100070/m.282470 type:complete len:153 (+) Transcript_100070:84-542(+)
MAHHTGLLVAMRLAVAMLAFSAVTPIEAASVSCSAAQLLLQRGCEQEKGEKVTCVDGSYVFDMLEPSRVDDSSLVCIPDNPFATFPDPGEDCRIESIGWTKFMVTFDCKPSLTALSWGLIVGGAAVIFVCCICCIVSAMKVRKRGPRSANAV